MSSPASLPCPPLATDHRRSLLPALNWFCQRVLGLNRSAPFAVHFTSQVYSGELIRAEGVTLKYLAHAGSCYFHGGSGIDLGAGTILAPGVKIVSVSHDLADYRRLQSGPEYRVVVGRRCWLGANSVLLPGCRLGDNVVVGAGAVVRGKFPANCIIAGVPAKIVRHLAATVQE